MYIHPNVLFTLGRHNSMNIKSFTPFTEPHSRIDTLTIAAIDKSFLNIAGVTSSTNANPLGKKITQANDGKKNRQGKVVREAAAERQM